MCAWTVILLSAPSSHFPSASSPSFSSTSLSLVSYYQKKEKSRTRRKANELKIKLFHGFASCWTSWALLLLIWCLFSASLEVRETGNLLLTMTAGWKGNQLDEKGRNEHVSQSYVVLLVMQTRIYRNMIKYEWESLALSATETVEVTEWWELASIVGNEEIVDWIYSQIRSLPEFASSRGANLFRQAENWYCLPANNRSAWPSSFRFSEQMRHSRVICSSRESARQGTKRRAFGLRRSYRSM